MSAALLFVAYLATSPTADTPSAPEPVRVITNEESRKACRYLGLVSVRKALGRNKPGGALKKALAEVAKDGGNGLFIINQSDDLFDGASVSGEALLCPQSTMP